MRLALWVRRMTIHIPRALAEALLEEHPFIRELRTDFQGDVRYLLYAGVERGAPGPEGVQACPRPKE